METNLKNNSFDVKYLENNFNPYVYLHHLTDTKYNSISASLFFTKIADDDGNNEKLGRYRIDIPTNIDAFHTIECVLLPGEVIQEATLWLQDGSIIKTIKNITKPFSFCENPVKINKNQSCYITFTFSSILVERKIFSIQVFYFHPENSSPEKSLKNSTVKCPKCGSFAISKNFAVNSVYTCDRYHSWYFDTLKQKLCLKN